MHHEPVRFRGNRESGAALMVMMLLLIVGASFMLVSNLNSNLREYPRQVQTTRTLSEARAALLSYAITYPETHASGGPGVLPCPDLNNDGTATGNCSYGGGTTIGRFPWKTVESGELRDHTGETLWYVVSDNFRTPISGPINSDTAGTLNVDDSDDIVAIILAPGEILTGQDRNPNDAVKLNDPENYLEGGNELHDNFFVTRGNGEFNDELVYISRAELMEAVEQRVLNQTRTLLSNYFDSYGSYPWLTPYSNPSMDELTATASSAGAVTLNDATADFVLAGVQAGDLVINETDDSMGLVNTVSDANTLTVSALQLGQDNDFDTGDTYAIPRYNAVPGTRAGLLSFHANDEAYLSAMGVDWFINNATTLADSGVTPSTYQSAMTTAIRTSDGTTSQAITIDREDGVCFWTAEDSARCKAAYIDYNYLSGTASTSSGLPDSGGRLTLSDDDRNFNDAGIAKGDLILNYSSPSGAALLTGTADAGSGPSQLLEAGTDFIAAGVVPRTYLVDVESDVDSSTATYLVIGVTANQLQLLPLPGEADILAENFTYSVYTVARGIVDTILSDTSIRVRTVTGLGTLQFYAGDRYSILAASDQYTERANFPTDISSFIVYETAIADFAALGVAAGDAVENATYGGIGMITATGTNANGAWFTYTALKGGSYPDIFQNESYRIHHTHVASRRYELDMEFTGTVNIPIPPPGDVRSRSVCVGFGADCSGGVLSVESLNDTTHQFDITLEDYASDGTVAGRASLTLAGSSDGRVRISDMEYDFRVADDNSVDSELDIPAWYVDNEWHHYQYIAYADGFGPADDGDCTAGADCLTITGSLNMDDTRALVISAGGELPDALCPDTSLQDRGNGRLCDYFEDDNGLAGDNIYRSEERSDTFNDKLLIIAPAGF